MRSLPLKKTQIYIKGDRLPDRQISVNQWQPRTYVSKGRQSRQSVIYCDFYTKKDEVENAIKSVISERFHVRITEIGLIWERGGDLFK
jgi:hypothetical protein